METETRPQEFSLSSDGAGPEYLAASFDTLVEARYEYMRGKWNGVVRPHEAKRYMDARRAFEHTQGRIVHEFWTKSVPGGVVLTSKRRPLRIPRLRPGGFRFFRFTDYLSGRHPDCDEVLFRGDALAAICEEVLRGPTQRIALTQVYTAASQLVSSLDAYEMSSVGRPAESPPPERKPAVSETDAERRKREAERQRELARWEMEKERFDREQETRLSRARAGYGKALARADRFYRDGSGQAAQFYYFVGMLFGAIVVAVLTFAFTQMLPVLADRWGLDVSDRDTAAGFAAAAAGSLGACVSVMWRMSAGTFGQDAVFGADNLWRLGAFRPFLGAMFGLILYVALQADVISDTYVPANPSWYFYIFLGFLAGFSERLVPDFLGDSEKGVSRRTRDADADDADDAVVIVPSSDVERPVITA